MADAAFSIEAAVASVLPSPAALQIAASATSAGEFSSGTAAFVGRLDIFWVKIGQEGLLVISVFKLVLSNMNVKSMTSQSMALLPVRIEYAVAKQRRDCIGETKS